MEPNRQLLNELKIKLQSLITEGKHLTFDNFADKSNRGVPRSFRPEWVTWQTNLQRMIIDNFVEESGARRLLERGLSIKLIGYGEEKFNEAQQYLERALQAAIEAVDNNEFDEFTIQLALVSNSGLEQQIPSEVPPEPGKQVFILSGADQNSTRKLERFLGDIGLRSILWPGSAIPGITLIDQLEGQTEIGYAFILLTPDEDVGPIEPAEIVEPERTNESRLHPNVIFACGYLVGRLGRSRVCGLYRGDPVWPGDLIGLTLKEFKTSVGELKAELVEALQAVGYQVELTKRDKAQIQTLHSVETELSNLTRRLQKLKEYRSLKGIDTEPHHLIEIEDLETAVTELQEQRALLLAQL